MSIETVSRSACIKWWGGFHVSGYGRGPQSGRGTGPARGHQIPAHRFIYEECFGPIPDGYLIHHKCENPACVNPEHLMAVTPLEHQVIHRRKSHCKHGHEFTPENTYVAPSGRWDCRACIRERVRRYQARKKAAA